MTSAGRLEAIVAARDGGDLGAAESLCREWLNDQPDDAEAHRAFGLVAEAAGRLSEAVASLRQAEKRRQDADILYDLGRLQLAQYRQDVRSGTLREAFSLTLEFGELDFPATDPGAAKLKAEGMSALEHCISKGADHVDAAGLLGLTLIESEETFSEAIGLLHRASGVNPGHPAVQFGLGILGMVQGQCAGGHAAFSNALAADAAMPGAEIMQTVAAYAIAPSGEIADALTELDLDDYHTLAPVLRMALRNTNLPDEVRSTYESLAMYTATQLAAAAVAFLDGSAAVNIGGRCLSQANQLVSGLADVYFGAGLILFENANFELAEMAFQNGLVRQNESKIGRHTLELSRLADGKEAQLPDERAGFVAADYRRIGAICCRNRMFEKAERFFREAIDRDPEDAQALSALSETLVCQERFPEALEVGLRAHQLCPDDGVIKSQLSTLYLSLGDPAGAWPMFEGRLSHVRENTHRDAPPLPRYVDQALQGKTLLIWREEGIGDELRLSTCLPEAIRAWPCKIVFECSPKLASLYERTFPEIEVRSEVHGQTDFSGIDYHLPMGSLPLHFRSGIDAFPASGSHLIADPDRLQSWRKRLDGLGPGLKIGVCWRSLNTSWSKRSLLSDPTDWGPVLSLPGVTFVNLQIRPTIDEFNAAKTAFGVPIHVFEDLDLENDIDGAAALVAGLDAVVTARCWMMLFAGGLGVKTYIFSSHPNSNMMELPYDPWFPDSEVHYRERDADWGQPMAEIRAALIERFSLETVN